MEGFLDATAGINLSQVLQVSMDGPNVNKKFLKNLKFKQKDENPDGIEILDIGSCGIHTIHNSYKKAMHITEWNISNILKALYYLFSHSSARRGDYIKYSKSREFPLKFSPIRWVENFQVADRARTVLPNVTKYIEGVEKTKVIPTCKSYKVVSSALKDKLLPAKLAFFESIASTVEPFLTRFQPNAPLAPLMYEELISLQKQIIKRFVKAEVLQSATLQLLMLTKIRTF